MNDLKKITLVLSATIVLAATLSAQTVYIPSGTFGIGSSTNSNVGIGTSSPGAKLDVQGGYIRAQDSGASYGAFMEGANGISYFGSFLSTADVYLGNSYDYGSIVIQSGNVGIGTHSPSQKLDVNGIIALSGNVFASYNWGDMNVLAGSNAFNVYNNAGSTALFSVLSAGNVGIGTSSPATKLNLQDAQTELSMGLNSDTTTYNRFGFNSSYVGYWTQNATWTGTQWNYVNAGGYGGAAVKLQEYYGSFQIDTASAGGSNPVPWITRLYVANSGNVGIGTTSPGSYKLAVNGTIHAKEVVVDLTGWSDYVFDDSYRLAPLSEVERHIKAEKHLPGIPSAAEVAEHGVSMGDMQSKLLAKVEELTLHLIAQEKRIEQLERDKAALQNR